MPISGKNGSVKIGVTNIAEITRWNFNPSVNVSKWGSSDSAGYKKAIAGTKDGSGSIEGKYDETDQFFAVIDVGTEVTLLLYLNATKFYSVPSVIESYDLEVDIDDGEVVGFSADYQTNGAWTNPA